MNYACHSVLLLLSLVLILANPASAAATSNQTPDKASIRIELKDGLLTAQIHDASLPQVLNEIGQVAGFKAIQIADFSDFPLVNTSFENLPMLKAVERLVANTNRIIFFAQAKDGEPQRVISQLWLLGPGEADAESTQSIVLSDDLQHEEAIKRSEAVLRLVQQRGEEPIQEKLAGMLQTDQDTLVRSRVAIALGALADERAVPDLESALLDTHFSVRAQSITALGQIGGERATLVLGSILLNEGIDSVERVMAAQALWKQNSALARDYLQAGVNDTNEQVSMASSKAPSSAVIPANSSPPGPEVTE
jgi:HEAT repeat protein